MLKYRVFFSLYWILKKKCFFESIFWKNPRCHQTDRTWAIQPLLHHVELGRGQTLHRHTQEAKITPFTQMRKETHTQRQGQHTLRGKRERIEADSQGKDRSPKTAQRGLSEKRGQRQHGPLCACGTTNRESEKCSCFRKLYSILAVRTNMD